jgi:hypothetical protein
LLFLASAAAAAASPCALSDLAGHDWTYIAPAAFAGGAWSSEHACVYRWVADSDSAATAAADAKPTVKPTLAARKINSENFSFDSPPGCLHDPWQGVVARGTLHSGHNTVAFEFNGTEISGVLVDDCSLIDTSDGGLYVRGYAGRSHPMDFHPHEYLKLATAWVVRSAMVVFPYDGSKHLTPGIPIAPGAKPHYYGYWLRDGFYGSSNTLDLVNASMRASFLQSYEWMFSRPRYDGIFPQSCHPTTADNKTSVFCQYGQGPANGDQQDHHNQDLDSCSFAVKSLYVFFLQLPQEAAHALFAKWKDALLNSFDGTTKDPAGSGLLWSNTSDPQVGYGFQDDEVKSGSVLYSSLLYWNATRLMAEMANATGDFALAKRMRATADQVKQSAQKAFWNDELGVFMASTGLESENIDVWGNALAGAMGFPTRSQDARMFAWFSANADKIFFEGQVREIPFPNQWTMRSVVDPRPQSPSDPAATVRTYQNGGYWATPHHHVLPWLGTHDRTMACHLLNETIASYRAHGIFEWIGPFFPAASSGAPGYTASAANTYFASKQLRCWE